MTYDHKSVTGWSDYWSNLYDALAGLRGFHVETVTVTKVETKIHKDPTGLIKRDLAVIKKYAKSKPYKVGDPLELVAWKQGQQDIIYMIEHRLVAAPTTQLT